VVFSTGGIGATPDDHTRQCAAKALGVELALHPKAEALIRERMQDTARDNGTTYEPAHPDNIHRLNMGVFPVGAEIIVNPYNKIPGFSCVGKTYAKAGQGAVHFVPGFPVMAWPMVASVLDAQYVHLFDKSTYIEKSVIVFGSMEAMLTPLMISLEREHADIKIFSLPSVDHPTYGRHIELGLKGEAEAVNKAYPAMLAGLHKLDTKLGPEMVR
jgi:molybdopterin-biosynthesis enzyme MoeA-like protein